MYHNSILFANPLFNKKPDTREHVQINLTVKITKEGGNANSEGKLPTNLSGGLGGFGHPTGATGVRQAVDLLHQFTGKASNQIKMRTPYGMMISMGGNDKTVTCIVVKKANNF